MVTEAISKQPSFSPYKRPQYFHRTTRLSTSCGLPPSLFFAKTHKTGGSSVVSLLSNFRKKHETENQTRIARLPKPFAGGYPGSFRQDLSFLFPGKSQTGGQKADFLTCHTRFQKEEVKAAMNPKARYLTILRYPQKQFESSFHYYFGKYPVLKDHVNRVICWTYPYRYVTNGKMVSFAEYISIADKYLNETAPWFFRSRNFQAYDLGLDPLNLNKEYVLQQARVLDETFHLVMILEHFLESLVLMKDLLCMDWEDVALEQPRNTAQYKRHKFSKKEERIVAKLTSQDQILYDYFNASLWRKIERYGYKKMQDDVATLQRYMAKAKDKKPKRGKRSAQRAKWNNKGKAVGSMTQEERIRWLQQQSKKAPKDESLAKNIAKYMTENYGSCPKP